MTREIINIPLKDHIKGTSVFVYCQSQNLWYLTETGLVFPVPVADIGPDTKFTATYKSIKLIRWIEKYLDELKESLVNI